ncbi:B-cell receptor-associated protein 31-like-domain-containing protein [Fimicolochytrium jonesii]|uniref:B-cell receptor-associated protein 31-like-domain-containing protein n=1 Tax=Fimicolochytrium jonesii TaxID=1396493 RepID=UPI0022FEC945|nr:B-cell receptor-associated protein 31-like-domain-containing protein [Fimicolochytrium jonesii]KAI8821688.1 B-cell receptor-associated protein 31-like-domain-containing protein [Fimicolochytrium jonesii]
MSLFNQLVYYMLVGELIVYLLTLVPLSFLPIQTRKNMMNLVSRAARSEPVVWTARIVFFIVAGVFLDTVNRLYRMEVELHSTAAALDAAANDMMGQNVGAAHHHHVIDSNPLARLEQKARLFYAQRNLYLSLFAIFMILVDYRRIRDVYLQLSYQEEIAAKTQKIRILTRQIENVTGVTSAVSEPTTSTTKKTAIVATPEVDVKPTVDTIPAEIAMEDLRDVKEGARKRGANAVVLD